MYDCPYDNLSVTESHMDAKETELKERPICEYCGYHIQDDYLWDIDGTLYHEKCAEGLFRKDADYYEQ